mgnify:CR=1 FL=1
MAADLGDSLGVEPKHAHRLSYEPQRCYGCKWWVFLHGKPTEPYRLGTEQLLDEFCLKRVVLAVARRIDMVGLEQTISRELQDELVQVIHA